MIPVFSHFRQVSLPWGWGEDQMPLKRPDGRWIIIKTNVINELHWRQCARAHGCFLGDDGAPSFLQYGMPHKPERASPHHERKEWVLYGKGMGRHYCE